jgi:hypothetical protein
MALVERLMGLADDGSEPLEGGGNKIRVHLFFAAAQEVADGSMTAAEMKAGFAIRTIPDASGKSDEEDLDILLLKKPSDLDKGGVALYLERLHGAFLLAEAKFPGYDSPGKLRAKLGI